MIVLRLAAIPLHEPFRISNGSVAVKESVVVEIRRDGHSGFGEAAPMPGAFYSPETPESSWAELEQRLLPRLLSDGWMAPREVAVKLSEASTDAFARAGLEGACWDLYCRERGEPLWRALGSAPRPIASGVAIGLYDTIEELLERVSRYLAAGYRRVKIKIQPGWDVEAVAAIRKQFGDIPLMTDANAAYTIADAPVFEELDRFGLMMFEQPLAGGALEEMAELQRRVRTPICADESAESIEALEKIIRLGSARIVNIKIQRVGGLAPALAMYERARAAGMGIWLGTMPELGIASAQGLHLATLPGFNYPTDVESSDRWFVDDLIRPALAIDRDGFLHIPDGPGAGYEVDREKLERYTTRKATYD
ncbi:MAG: o-succinylbenzoate synthase [Bryobacteraceae bacterium]|nr:o-succinylbenzoate synthase [Bryobacteraceae bacterium]